MVCSSFVVLPSTSVPVIVMFVPVALKVLMPAAVNVTSAPVLLLSVTGLDDPENVRSVAPPDGVDGVHVEPFHVRTCPDVAPDCAIFAPVTAASFKSAVTMVVSRILLELMEDAAICVAVMPLVATPSVNDPPFEDVLSEISSDVPAFTVTPFALLVLEVMSAEVDVAAPTPNTPSFTELGSTFAASTIPVIIPLLLTVMIGIMPPVVGYVPAVTPLLASFELAMFALLETSAFTIVPSAISVAVMPPLATCKGLPDAPLPLSVEPVVTTVCVPQLSPGARAIRSATVALNVVSPLKKMRRVADVRAGTCAEAVPKAQHKIAIKNICFFILLSELMKSSPCH